MGLLRTELDRARKPRILSWSRRGGARRLWWPFESRKRWSQEADDFVWQPAKARAREATSFISHHAALVWERRWTRMLSISCAISFVASLVGPPESDVWCQTGREALSLAEVVTHDPQQVVQLRRADDLSCTHSFVKKTSSCKPCRLRFRGQCRFLGSSAQ